MSRGNTETVDGECEGSSPAVAEATPVTGSSVRTSGAKPVGKERVGEGRVLEEWSKEEGGGGEGERWEPSPGRKEDTKGDVIETAIGGAKPNGEANGAETVGETKPL